MARILVVDDEAGIRELLTGVIQEAGYQVERAACGEEALANLERDSFDLVMFDINLGKESGIEVLKQIRARHPSVKVMMLTGTVDEKVAQQTKEQGAIDYLTKPFDVVVVWQKLEQALKS